MWPDVHFRSTKTSDHSATDIGTARKAESDSASGTIWIVLTGQTEPAKHGMSNSISPRDHFSSQQPECKTDAPFS